MKSCNQKNDEDLKKEKENKKEKLDSALLDAYEKSKNLEDSLINIDRLCEAVNNCVDLASLSVKGAEVEASINDISSNNMFFAKNSSKKIQDELDDISLSIKEMQREKDSLDNSDDNK